MIMTMINNNFFFSCDSHFESSALMLLDAKMSPDFTIQLYTFINSSFFSLKKYDDNDELAGRIRFQRQIFQASMIMRCLFVPTRSLVKNVLSRCKNETIFVTF